MMRIVDTGAKSLVRYANRIDPGWSADELWAYKPREIANIRWAKYHSAAYDYDVVRSRNGRLVLMLTPAMTGTIYVTGKWAALMETTRNAMWQLTIDNGPLRRGTTYIGMSGPMHRKRRRWTIPLYGELSWAFLTRMTSTTKDA